jgi:hypothetical protein
LEVKDSYTYLGLNYVDGQQLKHQLQARVDRARKVMHAMFGQCFKVNLQNAEVISHLFDTLVMPVLCFGCEVWGPDWISPVCRTGKFTFGDAEVKIHRPFMRRVLGVAESTTKICMMTDMNRKPIMFFWLRMACQLWNRAISRNAGDFMRGALEENVSLACNASLPISKRKLLWAYHVTTCLNLLRVPWQECDGRGGKRLLKIDIASLATAMHQRWQACEGAQAARLTRGDPAWVQDPLSVRAAPNSASCGFKGYVYDKWFRPQEWIKQESYLHHLNNSADIRIVAQFRLGAHWLRIQQDRGRAVARDRRVCLHCMDKVEDELHLLECPLYAQARATAGLEGRPDGGWTDEGVRQAFTCTTAESWQKLASFLQHCRRMNPAGQV